MASRSIGIIQKSKYNLRNKTMEGRKYKSNNNDDDNNIIYYVDEPESSDDSDEDYVEEDEDDDEDDDSFSESSNEESEYDSEDSFTDTSSSCEDDDDDNETIEETPSASSKTVLHCSDRNSKKSTVNSTGKTQKNALYTIRSDKTKVHSDSGKPSEPSLDDKEILSSPMVRSRESVAPTKNKKNKIVIVEEEDDETEEPVKKKKTNGDKSKDVSEKNDQKVMYDPNV